MGKVVQGWAGKSARVDWKTAREGIDLAKVATNLMGPAPGRRGEHGRQLWWRCPFLTHEDANPSFAIEPGKPWWRCYGCGEHGDAATLVMKLRHRTFPEAIADLTGGPAPRGRSAPRKGPGRPATRPEPVGSTRRPPGPSGLPEADALALVEQSEARLWSPAGAEALAYLTGPARGLAPATIRRARLGVTEAAVIPTKDGDRSFRAHGVVIPWFEGDRLALVQIRQGDGCGPKYVEAFRDPSRVVCYPGREAIVPGRDLVVVEGAFDALALGEVLDGLASVVTLGSASVRPDTAALTAMLAAPRWWIATDADAAGDRAAAEWPGRARRVRPPEPFKDWTEARAAGVDLARWWRDILAGIARPPLFTWPEMAEWRWGTAVGDPTPGIDVSF